MQIDATYQAVTPMFCGGADPAAGRAELRAASFKGVLRYWWRALAWTRLDGELKRLNGELKLKQIRAEEEKLFGSADKGQARVVMRLVADTQPRQIPKDQQLRTSDDVVVGPGARYLGYGVMEAFFSRRKDAQEGQLNRPCLRAPFDFKVYLRGSRLNDQEQESVEQALVALGTLGGMGAKSRKGYGSLALQSLCVDGEDKWQQPGSVDDLNKQVEGLYCGGRPAGCPEYTAFSDKTRHLLLSSKEKDPLKLLDLVGRELVRFRSWGRDGRILGGRVDSEKNFKEDHDLMKKAQRGEKLVRQHPKRVAFGLPHNYAPKLKVEPWESKLDRRASPLFIHIHQCADMPVAVLSFLPAEFLPKDNKGKSCIDVFGHKIELSPEKDLYKPVNDFLDRLLDETKRKESFKAKEIKTQP